MLPEIVKICNMFSLRIFKRHKDDRTPLLTHQPTFDQQHAMVQDSFINGPHPPLAYAIRVSFPLNTKEMIQNVIAKILDHD
jgi:hypothetical protein